MSRTDLQKAESIEPEVLRAGSRMRLRALALIAGAMDAAGVSKSDLGRRLGVGKSAVDHVLKGNGNLTLQTLAEYMGVLGYEIELIPASRGEIALSMRQRRPVEVSRLTMRDGDWSAIGVHMVSESRRGVATNASRGRLVGKRSAEVATPEAQQNKVWKAVTVK